MTQIVPLSQLATIAQGLVTSGQGAGARSGEWEVREVSLRNIEGDRIDLASLSTIDIAFNRRTEKHLLKPYDVLVTARSTVVKAALVPPALTPAVANSTLSVVRPREPEVGMFLWWFFTSRYGRAQLQARMVGSTVMLLRAGALGDIEVPLPERRVLHRIADLIETSEQAYAAAIRAAEIRHETLRDYLIEDLRRNAEKGSNTDGTD
jgi:restriction endonuclease S subunit